MKLKCNCKCSVSVFLNTVRSPRCKMRPKSGSKEQECHQMKITFTIKGTPCPIRSVLKIT